MQAWLAREIFNVSILEAQWLRVSHYKQGGNPWKHLLHFSFCSSLAPLLLEMKECLTLLEVKAIRSFICLRGSTALLFYNLKICSETCLQKAWLHAWWAFLGMAASTLPVPECKIQPIFLYSRYPDCFSLVLFQSCFDCNAKIKALPCWWVFWTPHWALNSVVGNHKLQAQLLPW